MADGSENPPGRPVVLAAATLCMVLRASFEIVPLRPPMPDVDVEQHGRIKDAMLARSVSQASEVTRFFSHPRHNAR